MSRTVIIDLTCIAIVLTPFLSFLWKYEVKLRDMIEKEHEKEIGTIDKNIQSQNSSISNIATGVRLVFRADRRATRRYLALKILHASAWISVVVLLIDVLLFIFPFPPVHLVERIWEVGMVFFVVFVLAIVYNAARYCKLKCLEGD